MIRRGKSTARRARSRTKVRWGCQAAGAGAAFALAIGTPAAARDLTRTAADQYEVDALRKRSPAAADLLGRGEALALAGAFEEADRLFKQAEAAVPEGSLLWRRDCEMLTLLGQREDAIKACNVALQNERSGPNFRTLIRALVTGPQPPQGIELSIALTLAQDPRRRTRGPEPTYVAAECDIAESLGDENMLQQCSDELRTIAPDEPDTKRALAILAGRCPPWRFWTGWSLILASVVATLGHAAARSARRRRGRMAVAMAASILAWSAVTMPSGVARAQESATRPPSGWLSKWPVNDDDPASSIPSDKDKNADPLQFGYWIQDLVTKAEHASRRGDHAAAARFWAALGVAVPDRAVSFTKACDEYEALGDDDRAIDACGQALLRDGLTVKDYSRFVHLVLAKPGPLNPKETVALGQVLDHMKADQAGRQAANDLECEIGVRTSNLEQLEECTAALSATAPDDPKTISYLWALAVQRGRFDEAKKLIDQAKAKGILTDGIESMERMTAAGVYQRRKRILLWVACLTLLAGGVGVSARLLVAARRRDPQPARAS